MLSLNSSFLIPASRLCAGIALALQLVPVGQAAPVIAMAVVDPLDRPAMQMHKQWPRTALLHMARAGKRLVAVGERGGVLLSDDEGKSWRQAQSVPVAVTLTATQFVNDNKGWAVGHSGVVLATEDGGEHWTRQLDGRKAISLALDEAESAVKSSNGNQPEVVARVRNAKQLVADGADKPFLDLYFEDERSGLVIGAYGIAFRTTDGGKTWVPWMAHLDNPQGLHLNAISPTPSGIWIVGERGIVLRAQRLTEKFTATKTPYNGSYFTVLALDDGVLIAGLKGHAYRSADRGKSWVEIRLPVPVSVVSATRTAARGFALTNQAGQILAGKDLASLVPLPTSSLPPVTALLSAADGAWVAATLRGPVRLPVSTSAVR